jgi:serine/threonine-protein kinase
MLCGRPPFEGGADATALTVIMKHVREAPQPPVELAPELPIHVNDAILKALSKDPAERFANCQEFVAALRPKARTGFFARPKTGQLTKSSVAKALAEADAMAAAGAVAAAKRSDSSTRMRPSAALSVPLALTALLLLGAGAWALLGRGTQFPTEAPQAEPMPVETPAMVATPQVKATPMVASTPVVRATPEVLATPQPQTTPRVEALTKPTPVATPEQIPGAAKPDVKKTEDEPARTATAEEKLSPPNSSTRTVAEAPRRAPRRVLRRNREREEMCVHDAMKRKLVRSVCAVVM